MVSTRSLAISTFPKTNRKYCCVVKFSLLAHRGIKQLPSNSLSNGKTIYRQTHETESNSSREIFRNLSCAARSHGNIPRKVIPTFGMMNARVENQRQSLQSAENLLLSSLRFAFSFTYERRSAGGSPVRFVGFAQLSPLRSKLNSQSTHPPCSHHARSHKKRFSSSFF